MLETVVDSVRDRASGARRELDWKHAAILATLTLVLWLPRLQGPIDLRWDAGPYYILGTSLAEGKGYRLLNEPGEIAAVQYPPLLPAIVALHQRVLGTSDPVVVGQALRLSYCALSLVYTLAVYAMARRFVPQSWAFVTGALTAIYVFTYFLSDLLFAEIPFAVATTLFVIADRTGTRKGAFAAALLATAAFLLRTIGIALLGAWIVEALIARRWQRAAVRCGVALVPVLLWQHYVSSVTGGPEYSHPRYPYQRAPYQYYNVTYAANLALLEPFRPEEGFASPRDLAKRVLSNVGGMAVHLGEGVSVLESFWERGIKTLDRLLGDVGLPLWPAAIPCVILSALVVSGLALFVRRGERLVPLYVLATLALICVTPWPGQFPRYLAPLTPFLLVCLSESLREARRLWPDGGRRLGGALLAVVFGAQVCSAARHYLVGRVEVVWDRGGDRPMVARFFQYGDASRSYDESIDWLKTRARKDEIVASATPHFVYLRTGLKAIMPPMELDVEKAQQLLDSVPVTWVIVDALDNPDIARRYAAPAVKARPDLWDEVYGSPDRRLRIYRRKP
jgi:hypothetical protein